MAQETIDLGTIPNDGTGDTVRVSFGKCNDNFDDLYGSYADNATTAALSESDLNTAYPSVIIGYKVFALDIIGGGLIYIKTSTGWASIAATIVV